MADAAFPASDFVVQWNAALGRARKFVSVMQNWDGEFLVQLAVGTQSFFIRPEFEHRENAEWMAEMLTKAIAAIISHKGGGV